MKKTLLNDLVKIIKNDYLTRDIKAVRYNEDLTQVKLFYNDKVVTLWTMNEKGLVTGWVDGYISLIMASRLYEIVKGFNENAR